MARPRLRAAGSGGRCGGGRARLSVPGHPQEAGHAPDVPIQPAHRPGHGSAAALDQADHEARRQSRVPRAVADVDAAPVPVEARAGDVVVGFHPPVAAVQFREAFRGGGARIQARDP